MAKQLIQIIPPLDQWRQRCCVTLKLLLQSVQAGTKSTARHGIIQTSAVRIVTPQEKACPVSGKQAHQVTDSRWYAWFDLCNPELFHEKIAYQLKKASEENAGIPKHTAWILPLELVSNNNSVLEVSSKYECHIGKGRSSLTFIFYHFKPKILNTAKQLTNFI